MTAPQQNLHERRGIKFTELVNLLGIREALVRGVITTTPNQYRAMNEAKIEGKHLINMGFWGQGYGECGTAGCIGGYLRILDPNFRLPNGMDMDPFPSLASPFKTLFFPNEDVLNFEKFKTKHIVAAIDNWLQTGDAQWEKIPGIPKWSKKELATKTRRN